MRPFFGWGSPFSSLAGFPLCHVIVPPPSEFQKTHPFFHWFLVQRSLPGMGPLPSCSNPFDKSLTSNRCLVLFLLVVLFFPTPRTMLINHPIAGEDLFPPPHVHRCFPGLFFWWPPFCPSFPPLTSCSPPQQLTIPLPATGRICYHWSF